MPKKINFTALSVTGEDSKFMLSELDQHGPTVKGWRSIKNCDYPQDIVIQLEKSCTLCKIQILTHQFLIPSKIEFFCSNEVKTTNIDQTTINWDYLGYITLSDNERTEFKSRELKSANVPLVVANFVKLRLYENHNNLHNTHNQISVIAINVLGLEAITEKRGSITDNPLEHITNNPDHYSPYDDLAFAMYVDVEIAKLIREMETKKQLAALTERFEYARKLKLAMEYLREAGEKLGKYELEKRHAIDVEDYERANLKKNLIEDYRAERYSTLSIEQLLETGGPCPKNDSTDLTSGPLSPPPSVTSTHSHTPLTTVACCKSPSVSKRNSAVSSPLLYGRHAISMSPSSSGSPATSSPTHSNRGSFRRNRNKSVTVKSTYEQYEEKPLPALRRSQTNEFLRDCHQIPADLSTERICSTTAIPSKLTERERKQASLPILVFGSDIVEKFYSKHYLDKEDGLTNLKDELLDFDVSLKAHVPNKTARAAIFLLHRTLRDKVFSVYSLANEVIRLYFVQFVPGKVTPAEVARSVDKLLPELLTKSGDTSARIHHMAVHTILTMADCQSVRDLHVIPVHLSRIVSSSTHPRLALSRAEMVEQLIINQGISTDKQSGLTCRTLSEFGSSGLHHPAEPVRKVAERILVLIYKVNPRLVRKQLPPDDDITRRNLLYRQLFQEFDKIDLQRKKEILEKTHLDDNPIIIANNKSAMNKCQSSSNISANKQEFTVFPLQKSISGGHLQQNGSGSNGAGAGIGGGGNDSDGEQGDGRRCMFCHVSEGTILGVSPSMNSHYWRVCPVLHRCMECSQVVEVSSLSQHLLTDCESSVTYTQCACCHLAYKGPGQHDRCPIAEGVVTTATKWPRCPLCYGEVYSVTSMRGENGGSEEWQRHLMVECKKNARMKQVKIASPSHYDVISELDVPTRYSPVTHPLTINQSGQVHTNIHQLHGALCLGQQSMNHRFILYRVHAASTVHDTATDAEQLYSALKNTRLNTVQVDSVGGSPFRPDIRILTECAVTRAWHVAKNTVKLELRKIV